MAALVAAAVAGLRSAGDVAQERPGLFVPADLAAAVAALPDGGLVYGEMRTGRVYAVGADGAARGMLAELEVGTNGDRGLLGIAVDPDGPRVFASWVDPDGRFRVGELTPGGVRPLWLGPLTADSSNGGRIVWTPEGTLLFGAGTGAGSASATDPAGVDGSLVELDPDGPVDQVPRVVSRGWHNPLGLAFDGQGRLWVADDTRDGGDSLARVGSDGSATDETTMPTETAVSGLAATGSGELLVCDRAGATLRRFAIPAGGQGSPEPVEGEVAPCSQGVAVLADERVAVTLEEGIRVLSDPAAAAG